MAVQSLLKPKDVARVLSISERAVYHMAKERRLPCVKWGKSVRFDPVDIAKFIEDNKHKVIDYEAIADTMCV